MSLWATKEGATPQEKFLLRIAEALERIADHFDITRGGSSSFITRTSDCEQDGSATIYTDDVEQFLREQKKAAYMEATGRILSDWEDVPPHFPEGQADGTP